MKFFRSVQHAFAVWIGSGARFALRLAERFRTVSEVRLIEDEDDSLTVRMTRHAKDARLEDRRLGSIEELQVEAVPPDWRAALRASRIQFVLRSSKFLFRPLELPKQASEFLDGIIRAQIDRLTPWSAKDAVYGWTPPTETPHGRLHLQVVATTRQMTAPYLQFAEKLGAEFVSVATSVAGADEPFLVKVLELRSQGTVEIQQIQRIMSWLFLSVGAVAAISMSVAIIIGGTLDGERQEISRRIAERRAAVNVTQDSPGSLSVLERRKRETPSSVMVLEALSRILPDHTSVTELRIENGKLQLIGITQDAPSLVRLMEQSPQFARATFFAPTTRSVGENAERFHIEAQLKPYFELGL
jgi:general secretion pathway protein L